MAKVGRPTKINPTIQEQIVKAIRAGNYIETASAYAGINKSTLYDWLKRGEREKQRVAKNPKYKIRKDEAPFVDFSNAVQKALADAEIRDVATIVKASTEHWQAAAWRLERKYPDRWGRKKVDIDVSGELGVKHSGQTEKIAEQLENDPDARELIKELIRASEDDSGSETDAGES